MSLKTLSIVMFLLLLTVQPACSNGSATPEGTVSGPSVSVDSRGIATGSPVNCSNGVCAGSTVIK